MTSFSAPGIGWPCALDQLRLVVEGVEVAERPGAEDHEHALRLRREVRLPRRTRLPQVNRGANGGFGFLRPQLVLGQQMRERDGAEAGGGVGKEGAASKQLTHMIQRPYEVRWRSR